MVDRATYKWLGPGVSTNVDLQVRLLVEALVATRHVALVSLSWLLTRLLSIFLVLGQWMDSELEWLTYLVDLWNLWRLWLLSLDSLHQSVDVCSKVDASTLCRFGTRAFELCAIRRAMVRRTRLQG